MSSNSNKLVIVESPAKARTIGRYLGKGYVVKASMGHVRDLPKSKLGVEVDMGFAPQYIVPREKSKTVKELKSHAADASAIFLATDPDREGEAIAWHLAEAIGGKAMSAKRVVFHEITKPAIEAAFAHPRSINLPLVDAQQARRVLDRLVGYELSPVLWRKVRRGLSAGRVQSVALRLVVEREREILAFKAEEYWTLEAELTKGITPTAPASDHFTASLYRVHGHKPELKTGDQTHALVSELESADFTVVEVNSREVRRNAAPPFTTSTLQQESFRRLRFSASRTMRVAQTLYEGVQLGGESVGLITYMRTDSVHIAKSAQDEAREYVGQTYGQDYVPEKPNAYRTRSKGAQEAHEAIRPTSVQRDPSSVRNALSPEQWRLYELVWKRFVASQMAAAVFEQTTVDIAAGNAGAGDSKHHTFRATGSKRLFAGFLNVYEEGKDEEDEKIGEKPLPTLDEGEVVDLVRLMPNQHFTQPPPRFSEATLVKALEQHGIGRPSTYAPILSTLQSRHYVEQEARQLRPTEIGFVVNDLLVEHFNDVVDVGFTAQMEERLDEIASGERVWSAVVGDFYKPFHQAVDSAANIERRQVPEEIIDEVCEECGKPMAIKLGRFGRFVACTGFPDCKNAHPLVERTGVECPKCHAGELVKRKGKKGRPFYGCNKYPLCDFVAWRRPVKEPCPVCGGLVTMSGRNAAECSACGHKVAVSEEAELQEV